MSSFFVHIMWNQLIFFNSVHTTFLFYFIFLNKYLSILLFPEQTLFILSFLNSKGILAGTIGWILVLRSFMHIGLSGKTTLKGLKNQKYLHVLSQESSDTVQLEKRSAFPHPITRPYFLLTLLKVFLGVILFWKLC